MTQNTPPKSVNSPSGLSTHQLLSPFLFQHTSERESCAICLCTLSRIDADITETKCNHLFHSSCLDEMKSKMKSKCPICRHPITPPTNPPRGGSPHHHQQLDNFYSHQSLHSHNSHHIFAQANIVSAARRGREAVQLAIASRRERDQLNLVGDVDIQQEDGGISSFWSSKRSAHIIHHTPTCFKDTYDVGWLRWLRLL